MHPRGIIGPSLLPGFYDRHMRWRSTAGSYLVEVALHHIVYHYLLIRPPVWIEEPYSIREVLSYCDTRRHKGTLYQAAGFEQVRVNAAGIAIYRKRVRDVTDEERVVITKRSQEDLRCQRLRATRVAATYRQLTLEYVHHV